MKTFTHADHQGQLPDQLTTALFDQLPWFVMIFNLQTRTLVFTNRTFEDWLAAGTMQGGVDLPTYFLDLYHRYPEQPEVIQEVRPVKSGRFVFKCNFRRAEEHFLLITAEDVSQLVNDLVGFKKNHEGFYTQVKKEPKLKVRDANQKIQELNRSNSELEHFAYVASHDLQEPLRKILAFGERLQRKFHAELPDDGKLYLERMMSATQRMRILIDNLLTLSRVSRKPEEHGNIDLNSLLDDIKLDLEIQTADRNGRIEYTGLPVVDGNKTQLQQLFQNLISNSLKFSRRDVPPHIVISSRPAKPEELDENELDNTHDYNYIELRDNGIGFEQKHAVTIFNVFERLHGRSEYEGTGIGLAICKRVVENHRGKIYASSVPEEGTTISIFLPA